MTGLLKQMMDDMKNAPDFERINSHYERGLITYNDAAKALIEAYQDAHTVYQIEYRANTEKRYKLLEDTYYNTESEATAHIPNTGAFTFRIKRIRLDGATQTLTV